MSFSEAVVGRQDHAFAQAIDMAMTKLQGERQSGLGFADDTGSAAKVMPGFSGDVGSACESDGYCSDTSMTREIMGEVTESRTVSGVDFDEWMQAHAVLEAEPTQEHVFYKDDDEYYNEDEYDEEQGDVRAAWMDAQRQWAGGEELEPECIALSSDKDDEYCEDEDCEDEEYDEYEGVKNNKVYGDAGAQEITATDIGQLFDACSTEASSVDSVAGQDASAGALSFLSSVAEQDGYQRPPVPPTELSLEAMAQIIVDALERSAVMANEVSAVCEQIGAEDSAFEDSESEELGFEAAVDRQRAEWDEQRAEWDEQRAEWDEQRAEWYEQRAEWDEQKAEWNENKTELEEQVGKLTAGLALAESKKSELQSLLTKMQSELAQTQELLANKELDADTAAIHLQGERQAYASTQRELNLARSSSESARRVQELEALNAELARRNTELEAHAVRMQDREQLAVSTARALEVHLGDALRKVRAQRTPSAEFLEHQRVCDARLVEARSETRAALERLCSAEGELRDEQRSTEILRKRLNEAVRSSPSRGAKKRKVEGQPEEFTDNFTEDRAEEHSLDALVLSAGEHARERRRSPQANARASPLGTIVQGSPPRISTPRADAAHWRTPRTASHCSPLSVTSRLPSAPRNSQPGGIPPLTPRIRLDISSVPSTLPQGRAMNSRGIF